MEEEKGFYRITCGKQRSYTVTIILFVIVNLILGLSSQPIIELIQEGLRNFG